MAMAADKREFEQCRAYVVRREQQREWLVKAANGDEHAKLCMSAAGHFMRAIPQGSSACACCDAPFSPGDVPQAFIVLIPTNRDPQKARAHAMPVCAECSKHDDTWLLRQGPKRQLYEHVMASIEGFGGR
jgi:hypothetical protein